MSSSKHFDRLLEESRQRSKEIRELLKNAVTNAELADKKLEALGGARSVRDFNKNEVPFVPSPSKEIVPAIMISPTAYSIASKGKKEVIFPRKEIEAQSSPKEAANNPATKRRSISLRFSGMFKKPEYQLLQEPVDEKLIAGKHNALTVYKAPQSFGRSL